MAISENDIRPVDLNEGKLKALEADLERLGQWKEEFIEVTCPACGSDKKVPAFQKFGFQFDQCENCATAYMNPRATPDILGEFYSKSVLYEYWNKFIFPATRENRKERIFRPRVKRILELANQHDVPTDIIFEIGSASGMFCEEALAAGVFNRVVGIEPGAAQAATCRDLGIEVLESTIEEVNGLNDLADIVVSFETIEHVFSPKDFVRQCHSLLAPNGLLVLTCPNYQGFDIMTLGTKSESLDAEHINMLNPKSLELLIENQGFNVLEVTTPGMLDAELVRNKILEGELSVHDQPFLKKILIDDWEEKGEAFQAYLAENLLSSHMWLVARKS